MKWEFSQNKEIMKRTYESCEKNKILRQEDKGKECTMEIRHLKSSAVELLYVNRYLDMENDFYLKLFDYFESVLFIKPMRNEWSQFPKSTEKWMLENKSVQEKGWEKMENYLKKLE